MSDNKTTRESKRDPERVKEWDEIINRNGSDTGK